MPTNDLFKTVNYNDGEGLTYGDANDAQRFLAARLNDQIFEKLISNFSGFDPESVNAVGANVSTNWAYCLSVTGAIPMQGSANNKVKIGAGTIFQKIANATGNEPTLLAYTFDGTLEFTLANGDATNPRVDMIQVQLSYATDDLQSRDFQDATSHVVSTQSMNKKRQVQATVSVKTGTPAASPTYPTPDAGYVPLACIVVDHLYAAAAPLGYCDNILGSGAAVLHDLRMPIKVSPISQAPSDGKGSSTNWAVANTVEGYMSCAATTGSDPDNEIWYHNPKRMGRVVGVALYGQAGTNAANNYCLGARTSLGTGPAVNAIRYVDLSATLYPRYAVASGEGPTMARLSDIEQEQAVAAGVTTGTTATIQNSTAYAVNGNGTHNPPLWGNGCRAYSNNNTITSGSSGSYLTELILAIKPQTGLIITRVIWYVAEGL